jgi:hypothetical protein
VQFVASHCGVVRNELADQAADQAFNRMSKILFFFCAASTYPQQKAKPPK